MGRYEYSDRLTTEECGRLSVFEVIKEEKAKVPLITRMMTDGDIYTAKVINCRTKKEVI